MIIALGFFILAAAMIVLGGLLATANAIARLRKE